MHTDAETPRAATVAPTKARAFDLKKVTAPVLLQLLQSELPFPRLFLWRCVRTLPRFKAKLDPRFPAELVEIAALPLWIYITLKTKLGQARAFANLCDQELLVNKTGLTRWNTLEVVERSDRRSELKVTRCLYRELAIAL